MKLLIVAMPDSIHTARWISQVSDMGWEIHLFSSNTSGVTSSDLRSVTVHHLFQIGNSDVDQSVQVKGISLFSDFAVFCLSKIIERFFPSIFAHRLAKLIKKVNPDIVHSLEMQHAGYLTLDTRKKYNDIFPPWIVTNWGSDIYLFGRLAAHSEKIKEVLALADFYSCECQRDVCLAKAYGFSGRVLPVFPNAGGFDLAYMSELQQKGFASERRVIMLKGYQSWAGRALVALRALERSSDMLKGYTVTIYSATPDVEIAAELFQHTTGIPVVLVSKETTHLEIMRWHGRARVSIGLSISDAISTSMLEAMVMGAFPIQSWTACADEWIEEGVNGLLVPPEDPEIVEKALRRVLSDDDLVNRAAKHNFELAIERLDHGLLRKMTADLYTTVAEERHMLTRFAKKGKLRETTS